MSKNTKLARQQLDQTLSNFDPLRNRPIPAKGWIRAIRDGLGMSGRQLAERLGVSRQRVVEIERDERAGSVTLKTMRRVAESLDSVFVYGFVPRSSLDQFVRARARQIAEERLARVSQTMKLEDQGLAGREDDEALIEMIDDLAETLPPYFWDQ